MSLIRILPSRVATVVGIAIIAASIMLPLRASAQSAAQQQLQIFNALPPAQQKALMQQLTQQMTPQQKQDLVNMLQGQAPTGQPGAQPPGTTPLEQGDLTQQTPIGLAPTQPEKPQFAGDDTLIITFTRRDDLTPRADEGTEAQIQDFQQRLIGANPYHLDDQGQLYLPGVPSIQLAGLDVEQATARIQAEPLLRLFFMNVTRLPLKPIGVSALKPFGYDLFTAPAAMSSALGNAPVPENYIIGPGDTVEVQLFGKDNVQYSLLVNRDGTIQFPQIGPINVAGLEFSALRKLIEQRVNEQLIGDQVSTTLGALRSIRVFVVGEVMQPGSYTVSGFSTMTNALFQSGGVTPIGSLRKIELRRDGKAVSTLDLYDLLLRGDKQGDARLQSGDVIFVPPVGATVSVDGEVKRPAVYEVKAGATVGNVIELAGGLNANADKDGARLIRIAKGGGTDVEDLVLSQPDGLRKPVRDGDVLRIAPNPDLLDNSVKLLGNVFETGLHEWKPGMHLIDLLPRPELVKPKSDLNYVLIRRELVPNVKIAVLSADLRAAWQNRGGAQDLVLKPRDTVYVFNLDIGRQQIIKPILQQLLQQAPPRTPQQVVRIDGSVRAPGEYPLESGMRISDLLRAGGGMSASAYDAEAELTRYSVADGQYRQTEIVDVDLAALLKGDASANLLVQPYDYLTIKPVPRWSEIERVTLTGEVRFPGTYPIRRGETLSSVLERAGGLTDQAYPQGSIFTRVSLKQAEEVQLKKLAARIQSRIASLAPSNPDDTAEITAGQNVVKRLQEAQATGRLVIRLGELVAGDNSADIRLDDGDTLKVPQRPQEVTVLGEVQYPTSHVYDSGDDRKEYINKSGGLTARADKRRIYVVRANGAVVAEQGGGWFQRGGSGDIEPGDTIVVPTRIKQGRILEKVSSATQILYNLAIAAAAANGF